MRLSGQEYVDEYAAVVKLRLAGEGGGANPRAGPPATPQRPECVTAAALSMTDGSVDTRAQGKRILRG